MMDGRRFDMLTRRLAGATTRRSLLRVAAATVVTGGAMASVAEADAQRRGTCRPLTTGCLVNAQCCSMLCDRRSSTPRRQRNRCVCPEGTIVCGNQSCVEPGTMAHCEGCTPCDETRADICLSGVCMCDESPACAVGDTCCGAEGCHDLQTDNNNCGECGNACPTGTTCDGGVCACETVAPADICMVKTNGDIDQVCTRYTWSVELADCETDGDCGTCPSGAGGCSCVTGFREYGDFMSIAEWSNGTAQTFCMAWEGCG